MEWKDSLAVQEPLFLRVHLVNIKLHSHPILVSYYDISPSKTVFSGTFFHVGQFSHCISHD